jgi:NADPH:quinone reductase-like Zn-dependent oxidoreductase
VTRFKVGNEIYGTVNWKDGKAGSYAEYVAAPESRCVVKPAKLSHAEAAAVPIAGWTALQCLRTYGGLKSGGSVLILGASGGVGTYAVQAAKALGAKVTAVCGAKNTSLVKQLGADLVVDYQVQDPMSLPERFDVVLDGVANGYSKSRKVLKPRGVYVTTSPGKAEMAFAILSHLPIMRRCKWMFMKPVLQDMEDFNAWLAEGKVKSVLGKTFPLAQAKEAHLFSETHHAAGKIILEVD